MKNLQVSKNNALVSQNNYMPSPEEFDKIMCLCKTLAGYQHYAKLGIGGVLAIWMTAREMGLPPMLCLNGGLYTFSGAVTLSSNLINMLITNAGHRVEVVKLDEKICILDFVRCDRLDGEGKKYQHTFTIEDAIRAGVVGKDNWKKYPKSMLFARCMSAGGKIHMPEILMGVYVHGEIEGEEIIIEPEKQENLFELKKLDDVDQFKNRHNIVEGEKIYDYVQQIANAKNLTLEEVLNQCFLYEPDFLRGFENYKLKNS